MSEDDVKIEIQETQNRLNGANSKYSGAPIEYTIGLELLIELKKVRLAILENTHTTKFRP